MHYLKSNKMEFVNKIICDEAERGLKNLPDKSIDCCVSSPSYWGLRDYGMEEQLGLENTPEEYVKRLVKIFAEVKRVLTDDGTIWLNLADTYWGGKGKNVASWDSINNTGKLNSKGQNIWPSGSTRPMDGKHEIIKPKDLVGIPWMVAFALRADGWYLRQDIIWNKPNPMPESVTDRCTKAHEYIFLFSKSRHYYYDAQSIKVPVADGTIFRMAQQIETQKGSSRVPGKTNGNMKAVGPGKTVRKGVDTRGGNQGSEKGIPAMAIHGNGVKGHSGYFDLNGNIIGGGLANKKSVWTITTKPLNEEHFAAFPQELIVDCIKAGCRAGGLVLDPFMGSGTTAIVAKKLNRNYVGFELNPKYIKIAQRRLNKELGLFA